MPAPHSAGILLFRKLLDVEVLLIRPGGPFWRNREAGAWMIPKGAVETGETAAEAALREFEEETGTKLDAEPFPIVWYDAPPSLALHLVDDEGRVTTHWRALDVR